MKLFAPVVLLAGAFLAVWGVWVFYNAATNYEPSSEFPTWWGYAVGVAIFFAGALLLWAGLALRRRVRAASA